MTPEEQVWLTAYTSATKYYLKDTKTDYIAINSIDDANRATTSFIKYFKDKENK